METSRVDTNKIHPAFLRVNIEPSKKERCLHRNSLPTERLETTTAGRDLSCDVSGQTKPRVPNKRRGLSLPHLLS